jgi:uncharacterized cupin superfamily protein
MLVRPPFLVHATDLPETESAYRAPFDAEKLSWSRNLGQPTGAVRLGYWYERLPPGRRMSFTHAHSLEEEAVWVIAGRCHLRLRFPDGRVEEHEVGPGDFVCFPAGTGIAHTFVNHGTADFEALVVGEHRPDEDRCRYPEDSAYDAHLRATNPERHWSS